MEKAIPVLALALAGLLAACSGGAERYPFNGAYFDAKAGPIDKKQSRAAFVVNVAQASQSLDGARRAGEYEATRYCIENYGTSDVLWAAGPETAGISEADMLTLQGTCDP